MTIQRYAVIDGLGNVVSVVNYDNDPNSPTWHGAWAPPSGQTMVLDTVGASPGWTYVAGIFTPPVVVLPTPTPLQAAQAQLNLILGAGCQIVSTSNPLLNGTYAMDPMTLLEIASIEASLARGDGLPGATATFLFHDMNAASHVFSAITFPAFAKAIRDYFAAAKQAFYIAAGGGAANWPAQPVTIA